MGEDCVFAAADEASKTKLLEEKIRILEAEKVCLSTLLGHL